MVLCINKHNWFIEGEELHIGSLWMATLKTLSTKKCVYFLFTSPNMSFVTREVSSQSSTEEEDVCALLCYDQQANNIK